MESGITPRQRATVRVVAVADQGMALARLDGKAVFVPFAAPGDLLEVELTRSRKNHAEARILRVLEHSPLRRPPPCPHFGVCGGCQWQHLPYPDQLTAKNDSYRGFLQSRLGIGAASFLPPLASPEEWGYRNRAGFKVRKTPSGVAVGYFEKGSHRIVPVSDCLILHKALRNFLSPLRDYLERSPSTPLIPQVDLQLDGSEGLWAIFHGLRPFGTSAVQELRGFCEQAGLAGAHLQVGRKSTLTPVAAARFRMPFPLRLENRVLELAISPGGFAQANTGVNRRLVEEVLGLADLYRGKRALDLCCGAGNFTLPLAIESAEVVGVEVYRPAARDAEDNARGNKMANVRILSQPVESALTRLCAEGYRPDFVLLDPPREGMGEPVRRVADLAPSHVLYISCAPPTLVRDLGILQGRGYRVQWTRMADMFPQTAHTECITLLVREG